MCCWNLEFFSRLIFNYIIGYGLINHQVKNRTVPPSVSKIFIHNHTNSINKLYYQNNFVFYKTHMYNYSNFFINISFWQNIILNNDKRQSKILNYNTFKFYFSKNIYLQCYYKINYISIYNLLYYTQKIRFFKVHKFSF